VLASYLYLFRIFYHNNYVTGASPSFPTHSLSLSLSLSLPCIYITVLYSTQAKAAGQRIGYESTSCNQSQARVDHSYELVDCKINKSFFLPSFYFAIGFNHLIRKLSPRKGEDKSNIFLNVCGSSFEKARITEMCLQTTFSKCLFEQ
jgi:hypothetical protein